ncbi:hypothetical protein BHYA_0007g00300 [Botrytis hyacinthi]|uniref:Uncharacterized protein n=1 Tax=Botrytis hyacinthi TaxID=278943 RepID=A0A4Z1H3T4_9HELO|nr:hypothetical protein BHYA_0007g00300 [Botrytis hyacinthi]
MALYEKHETTRPAMWEIMKADDFKVTLATVEASRAKRTATVKSKTIYVDYHLQIKMYYVEKLMWRELFNSHPFPGVKPKPVAGAQPATGENSKHEERDAPSNLTKEQENSAKAKAIADAAAAKKAAEAEAAKAKAKATAAFSAKPTPPSAPSRVPRPPMLTKQDNSSIPLYAVGPVHYNSAKSWLVGPKVRDACAECQKFLGAYYREAAKVQPRSKPLFADEYFPTWAATVGYSPAAVPATNAPLLPNAMLGTTSSAPTPQDLKEIDDALESDHIDSWSEEVEAEELDDEVKKDKVEEEWVIDLRIAKQKKLIAHHKSKPRFHGKSDEEIW